MLPSWAEALTRSRHLRPAAPSAAAILFTALLFLAAAPAALADAPFGNALRLDGTNDYASAVDSSSLDLGDSSGEDFTLEAFVYVPDETSEAVQLIFYKQNAYRLSVNFNTATPDVLIFGVWGAPTGSGDQLLNSATVTAGWHHVAAVYDNGDGSDRLAIYLDGTEIASTTAADYDPGISNSTNLLSVGANSGAAPWKGFIDEARLSSTARYSGDFEVPSAAFTADSSTRALWHFNESACFANFADPANSNTLTAQNGASAGLPGAETVVLFNTSTVFTGEAVGTATVDVARCGAPGPVQVDFATSGGFATAGFDYNATSGTLQFAAGDNLESFNVSILQNDAYEVPESVTLLLEDPVGAMILGPALASLTINDDDPLPTITVGDASLTESDSGQTNATFTVTRTGATEAETVIDWSAANGTATAPGDFTLASATDLTLAPTETTTTFDVPVQGDVLDEPDETFAVDLNSATNAGITDAQGVGTITDDDDPPTISVQDPAAIVEGNAGTKMLSFTVQLAAQSGKTVTVNWATANGSATSPGDFTATGGALTFNPGQTQKTVQIPIQGDTVDEPSQTLGVALSSLVNAAEGDVSAQGTIVDDDPAPTLAIRDRQAKEGNSGLRSFAFTVHLTGLTEKAVTVKWATKARSAVSPSDFVKGNGALTFTPGQTTKTIVVKVKGDRRREGNETFTVRLSAPVSAVLARAVGIGRITNDD